MLNNLFLKVISIKGDYDLGLFVLRIFIGLLMFLNHGIGKITAGFDRWDRLGHAFTDMIGIEFGSVIFGFLASFAESIGAIFILAGFLTRLSSFLLFFTMFIASLKHFFEGDISELAIIYALVSIVIIITGPGRHSVDHYILKKID